MWRDQDGNFHSVALPDPSEVFDPMAFPAVQKVLQQATYEDVAAVVERLELAVVEHWEECPFDGAAEAPFVDLAPPTDLVDRPVVSLEELEEVLSGVDPRWALDVATALDDLSQPD